MTTPAPKALALQGDALGDEAVAALSRAFSHPVRLQILRTLAARGSCTCGEVVDAFSLAQSTVSQHLKALREAGLISGETDGPRVCYCLDATALARAEASFSQLLSSLVPTTDCTC